MIRLSSSYLELCRLILSFLDHDLAMVVVVVVVVVMTMAVTFVVVIVGMGIGMGRVGSHKSLLSGVDRR